MKRISGWGMVLALTLVSGVATAAECDSGFLGDERYSVSRGEADAFGRFRMTIALSETGKFSGRGRYASSGESGFALTEATLRRPDSREIVSYVAELEGDTGTVTVCVGKLNARRPRACATCFLGR